MAFSPKNPLSGGCTLQPRWIHYSCMLVIITDLDGTLLDADFSFEAAVPALDLLKRLHVPLVLCTSKTRAEVEFIRRQLGNNDPFIVENGGALYIPNGCIPLKFNAAVRRGDCIVIEFGDPYPELVRSIARASTKSGCTVRGFHQMSVREISGTCKMPEALARLAKLREYDEPFMILDGDPANLIAGIEGEKKRCTRGGNFYHILGANDKAHCVNLLIYYYRLAFERVQTIGLGDGLNDAGFLRSVDFPLILESSASNELKAAVPRGEVCAGGTGPKAWNAAVLNIIDKLWHSEAQPAPKLSTSPTRTASAGG
jgi:mannosyl-3-phosphoglycerate phosphatase